MENKYGFEFDHSDFDDDSSDDDINYITIHKGLPDELVNAAKRIDGENFVYSCFVLVVNHEKETDEYTIVDLYYIENYGEMNYFDDYISLFDDEKENIINCIKKAKADEV